MAHVVGVPKRDPCQKCGLPVFLAERLTVGKRVYHRTCLKCARCSFQLTPGSFYETEVDGEYCCETCPDEENGLGVETEVVLRTPSAATGVDSDIASRPKSAIADRLAFFEKSKAAAAESAAASSSKVLQKSLSDEEKTKSLKKISGEASSPYKMNAALSNFMHSTLDDEIDGEVEGEGDTNDNSLDLGQMDTSESIDISSDSDDDNDESEDKPPELPTSLPPEEAKSSNLQREHMPELDQMKTLKSEMKIQLIQKQEEPLTDPTIKNKDNAEVEEESSLSSTSIQITKPADDLNLSKSNFVTKDNTEPDEQMRTTNATIVVEPPKLPPPIKESVAGPADVEIVNDEEHQEVEQSHHKHQEEKPILRQRPITLDIRTNCNSDMTAALEDAETANRLSVVRARLHQFEVIAKNKKTNDNLINNKPQENSSSISSSSIKSDSIKSTSASASTSTVTEQQKDEDEMAEETISTATKESCPSIVVDTVQNMEESDDEVPKNDEKVEVIQETQIETVSIEEIKNKEENNEDDEAMTPAIVQTPPVAASPELAPGSLKKIVPIGIEIDDDEDDQTKQPNKLKETAIEDKKEEESQPIVVIEQDKQPKPFTSPAKVNLELYPEELNPFKSDDEDDDIVPLRVTSPVKPVTPLPRKSLQQSPATSATKKEDKDRSLNPFDSSDDEVEIEKKVKPPRPPPPKVSKNPFGSESDDDGDENCSKKGNMDKRPIPVPKPRTTISQNPTPEPTPRLGSRQSIPNQHISPLNNSGDFYGSNSSLGSTPQSLLRNSGIRGSNVSLTSSTGTIRSRKSRKAPAPPCPVKELFPSTETLDSKKSSPSSSNSATPKQGRKKRPAPAPPKPARLLDPAVVLAAKVDNNLTGSKNSLNYPLQSDLDKLSDEEKALLEGNRLVKEASEENNYHQPVEYNIESKNIVQKLIPLDISLISDSNDDLVKQKEEDNVVYRRTIIPKNILTPTHDESPIVISHDRQLEKMKDNKEAQNRNRQSQVSSGAEDSDPLYNKSSHGKWKRRKGPAPALPIPPRKVLQMLPLQEIRHELDIIEVQQQGLEKQGVILEKMIRDRCEGKNGELNAGTEGNADTAGHPQNSKEVEDLILQLFELVNEKNELFRRQAELMYLRRQHRLEQEQADLEYEIRVLMAQPERNKTDTDKAREEALIARMVEVVQLRNEVVECLEMDRLREAEEDLSIKQRLELHSAKREEESNRHTLSKLSKKEKKKQKESKKLGKSKKLDADKDADESELGTEKQKPKKKKKKFLF